MTNITTSKNICWISIQFDVDYFNKILDDLIGFRLLPADFDDWGYEFHYVDDIPIIFTAVTCGYPAVLDEELDIRLAVQVEGEICYQFEALELVGTMSCLRVLTADGNIYNDEPNLTRIRRAILEGKIVGYSLDLYQK